MKDPDEVIQILTNEFAVLLNPKTTLTPHLCRKGCKHYDSVGDQKSAEFREFCWKSEESRIEYGSVCRNFESEKPSLSGRGIDFLSGRRFEAGDAVRLGSGNVSRFDFNF
jgi:hypothetical protein